MSKNKKFQKTLKAEKGITLIALVITIVILIILATVSINVVLGEGGLIQRAQEGKSLTDQAQTDEQEEITGAEEYINGILVGIEDQNPPGEKSEVAEAIENGTKYIDTTPIKDDLENTVYIPGGFHLAKDSGTKVEEGIVIEDDVENQFVWIPTGTYNVTTEVERITEPDEQDGKLTNALSRRIFSSSGSTLVNGDDVISSYYYGEGNTKYTSVAKEQIAGFKTSATNNKGFYVGRYEAGTETERKSNSDTLTTPLVQANKYPYVYVSRDQAKLKAETIYSGNEGIKATSELISSYAWDTALNFICQTNKEGYLLATATEDTYGNIGTSNKTQTGEYEADDYSNIYDFLGNRHEWTTEYSSYSDSNYTYTCVNRGGSYYDNVTYSSTRFSHTTGLSSESNYSFRLQLYV